MSRFTWPLLVLAAACDSDENSYDDDREVGPPSDTPGGGVSLRLDVVPGFVRDEGDDSAFRALPQTFRPLGLTANDLSVGTLELFTPQPQTGSVVGYLTNPQIAVIPGEVQAVDATVWMRSPGTVQSVFTRTGTAGAFELWVVPRSAYRLEIVPDNPLFPVWSTDLSVGAVTVEQNIDLGTGVPVYGVVSSSSGPVVGAQVFLVDDLGLTSSPALTDEFGIYQVRATPGTWTVVCAGRELGRDPTITLPAVEVGDLGANVDVTYPTSLETLLVEGRLVSENGANVQGSTIRLTAETLLGFESVAAVNGHPGAVATWVTETPVGANGTILTRVVGGDYTIEVLPPTVDSGPDFSPERMTAVALTSSPVTDLGTLTVTPLVAVGGRVEDESADPIPDAVVTCVEAGFDHRFWTAVAGADGSYAIDLPEVLVHCNVSPPAGRMLASTRASFDPGAGVREMDFTVPAGVRVMGTVTIDGAVEPFAVVNVYDDTDSLLGFGLTGTDGQFVVPVDLD